MPFTKPYKVDVLAFLLCVSGLVFPSFLLLKANRLAAGDGLSFYQIAGLPELSAVFLSVLFLLLFSNAGRFYKILLVSSVLSYTVYISGAYSAGVSADSMFVRVSFSTGFWMFFLGCTLFYLRMLAEEDSRFFRAAATLIIFVPLCFLVFAGGVDKMSVMLEYANYKERFNSELIRHLAISFGSIFLACCAGIPAGIYSAKRGAAGRRLFDFLNIVQTVPSIALFGLLMAPFAWLSTKSELLQSAGVSGIGWAPAVTALFLYSLLPIARNTCEGVESIDKGVTDAAKGVGMTEFHMLFRVELPLSLPVILNGVRVALVQSIGNTAVVSLIGAGGLGIFIFQGLGQAAAPLIVLGTIPTIILAVLADCVMQLIISFSRGQRHDRA